MTTTSPGNTLVLDDPLAEYVSPEEHEAHAVYAHLVASYHELKAMAMKARLAGDIQQARGLEDASDAVAAQVEARTP